MPEKEKKAGEVERGVKKPFSMLSFLQRGEEGCLAVGCSNIFFCKRALH